MILYGAAAYLLINLVTIFTFRFDKRRAETGGWRIKESTLLSMALVGGSLGAKMAQRRFRHKTRKQPFATILNLIIAGQLLLIGVALFLLFRS